MQENFARKGLVDPHRLRDLNRKSDLRGWLQMASHFGAILVTGLALHATWGTWWAIPVFMLHGTLLAFLYAAQHELSHATVFKTRWLNEAFGRVIGFLQLFPRDFDQVQHFAHHRHTQMWEDDGELQREPYDMTSYLLWVLGPTYWWSRVARIARLARGSVVERYVRPDEKPKLIREARIHVGLYAAIAVVSLVTGSWAAVIYWLAPLIVMKPIQQLQNTIEHLGLGHHDNILENTRTVDTIAPMRWMGWNMQYHTAHHTFPSVPFHRLADLHTEIVQNTGQQPHTMGYLEFQREILARFAGGKSEADYPEGEAWVVSGKQRRAPQSAGAAVAGE
ncbi:MAG: fatty acid desaturase [Pseudomonadota bacterium]